MGKHDLSEDQARFVAGLAERTGLDPLVVKAWVGSESGWSKTKANHNYLNVGPGESYTSTDQAVGRAGALIGGSPRYQGIRASIPGGPRAQIEAIGKSAWGTDHARLAEVYGNLLLDGLDHGITGVPGAIADTAGKAAGAAASALGLDTLYEQALLVGLGLVFTLASFGLIALGLSRLTDITPKAALSKVQSVTGAAGMARSVATAAV